MTEDGDESAGEEEEEEVEEEVEVKTKKETVTTYEFERVSSSSSSSSSDDGVTDYGIHFSQFGQVNNNIAIWARNSKDVTDEEYEGFYKAITKVR